MISAVHVHHEITSPAPASVSARLFPFLPSAIFFSRRCRQRTWLCQHLIQRQQRGGPINTNFRPTATPCVNIIEIIDDADITGLAGTYSPLLCFSFIFTSFHIHNACFSRQDLAALAIEFLPPTARRALTLVVLLSCSKQLISPTKLISPPMIIPSVSLFRMDLIFRLASPPAGAEPCFICADQESLLACTEVGGARPDLGGGGGGRVMNPR